MLLVRANAMFDRMVRPRMTILGRSMSSFHVCGLVGVTAAVVLANALVLRRGGSPLVMMAIDIAAMVTFLALAMAQKLLTGEERLVYYQQEIGVMVVATLLLRALHIAPLLYLDATLLGIGVFLACGRVGCTLVGCCHGRPHRFGIRYRREHADAGFTPYYVGIRLFPVQTIEAIWVAFATIGGAWLVWHGAPAGAALAWYVVLYDCGRFVFELVRGDADRPYYLGFSQAQWLSAILLLLVVAAERRGILPWQTWHAVTTALLIVVMAAMAIARRIIRSDGATLLHPHHVHEVAGALDELAVMTSRDDLPVASTSRGVLISAGAAHYSFSRRGDALTEEAARAMAALVTQLRAISAPTELLHGGHGVYHLVVRDP